jgi:hypothetical protein
MPKKLQEKKGTVPSHNTCTICRGLNFKLFGNFIKNQTENESCWQTVLAFFNVSKCTGFYAFALKIVCKKVLIYRAAYVINFLFVKILIWVLKT